MELIPKVSITRLIQQVNEERLRHDLFYLSKDPLPFRKVNYTLPGHSQHTLAEADKFIQERLEEYGYKVDKEVYKAQAFRCDRNKPLHHWYSQPQFGDPWYILHNVFAKKQGDENPAEIVLIVSHKDSPSWYESPGAYDNTVGTIANLEIARLLRGVPTKRSVWFLWCNEEHWPWTSVHFAETSQRRGDKLTAIFNLDSLGGKSLSAHAAGIKTNVSRYSTHEGKPLADLMDWVNQAYSIGLEQSSYAWDETGDDDGSFIKAGFPAAVMNLGSFPYADPNYHMEGDTPENVDLENVVLAVQASLAAVLHSAQDDYLSEKDTD
jgi:hypothetical protein